MRAFGSLSKAAALKLMVGPPLAVVLVASALSAAAQLNREFSLAPDSPLATDGRFIYAVADDHATILRRRTIGVQHEWEVVLAGAIGQVRGLAVGDNGLFVSDGESGLVSRLDLRTRKLDPLGIPRGALRTPGDLAYAGNLFVADDDRGTIVQIDPRTGESQPLDLKFGSGRLLLAASSGQLLVASTDTGEIVQIVGLASSRSREPTKVSGTPATRRDYPELDGIAAMAAYGGNVYAIDMDTRRLHVAYRQLPSFIPIASSFTFEEPARLLVTQEDMFVLDAGPRMVGRLSRFVPIEFDLGRYPQDALDGLYFQLNELGILPTRSVPWRGNVAASIRSDRITFREPSEFFRIELSCWLNPVSPCPDGEPDLPDGAEFIVPDLPSKSLLDFEILSASPFLPWSRSIGDEVDSRIHTDEFRAQATNENLLELNPRVKELELLDESSNIRDVSLGRLPAGSTIRLPTERIIYTAAIPVELFGDYFLDELREKYEGFDWLPLVDSSAKSHASRSRSRPMVAPPTGLATVHSQYQTLMQNIGYQVPIAKEHIGVFTLIGVAEGIIDKEHGDLASTLFLPLTNVSSTPSAAPAAPPSSPANPAPPPPPPPEVRDYDESDHGTAVTWLLTSQNPTLRGIASHAGIVELQSVDPAMGNDIQDAYVNRGVRIFNLSLHLDDKLPHTLRKRITSYTDALFVVSAGNDKKRGRNPICVADEPYPAYPVCEGHRQNVLVVAGTVLDGNALFSQRNDAPGSNWNKDMVYVAAPGEGFHAGGRESSYVPVRGTSFAAPLVTGTAALLFGQGIKDPWLIKQRIVATADFETGLAWAVYGGGRLNVTRAVTHPTKAAIVPAGGSPTYVELIPGPDIAIQWETGGRTLQVEDVRRLTRTQNTYRIVYFDDVTEELIIQENVEPAKRGGRYVSWTLEYRALDANGVPTGGPRTLDLQQLDDYVGPVE